MWLHTVLSFGCLLVAASCTVRLLRHWKIGQILGGQFCNMLIAMLGMLGIFNLNTWKKERTGGGSGWRRGRPGISDFGRGAVFNDVVRYWSKRTNS